MAQKSKKDCIKSKHQNFWDSHKTIFFFENLANSILTPLSSNHQMKKKKIEFAPPSMHVATHKSRAFPQKTQRGI